MKIKEINLFDESLVFAVAYESDGLTFCTECFEKDSEWGKRILNEYGETEVTKIKVEKLYSLTVLFTIDKETCFKISREIMNRYMPEDDSWQETE